MLLIGTTAITWSSQTVAKPGVPGPPALDTLVVSLNGTGVLSADYLYSGGWHHVVVQKSGTTGEQVFPQTKIDIKNFCNAPAPLNIDSISSPANSISASFLLVHTPVVSASGSTATPLRVSSRPS